jgi:hypothetical protein
LAADDGWPRVLQACKGDGNKRLLDQDKKGSSKAKEDKFVVYGFASVVDRIKSRTCGIE